MAVIVFDREDALSRGARARAVMLTDKVAGLCGRSSAWLLHIGRNARRDSGSRRLHRLSREVGVTSGGLHLPVAAQLPDHRQALAQS